MTTGEVYQMFEGKLILIFCKLFQNTGEAGTLFNSFYEARVILIPKPEKYITRKKKEL